MEKNCETCRFCFCDWSVGARECTNNDDNWTDDEVVKYYEDENDGCPHWQEVN